MKSLIRLLIRNIPRPVLIRFSTLFSSVFRIWYRGNSVECPVCNRTFRKFMPYGINTRSNVLCPGCLSLERHRLIWVYLTRETDFFTSKHKFLHVAPEQCFQPRFKKIAGLEYLTADLESPIADMHFDLHSIPLEDSSFDFFMCNHVLEHVDDDAKVMREIFRVLRAGGTAILQVPQDYSLEKTYEDSSITDPLEREKHFLQKDHVRLYGMDYPERLRKAGFEVEELHYASVLGEELTERYRLPVDEILYLARKKSR
ncbi:MAG: methyltransferase domain-containing protein [Bacteroidota bacterium]|nr:methyltransferase domain-containing protein [Bacteroidota bacterium]